MKRIAVALITLVALAAPAPSAAATSYCSPTGDYCHSAAERGGVVRLSLQTFSFRGRVRVCVDGPAAGRTCKRFRLRRGDMDTYGFRVRWSRHFPNEGAGTYRVAFRRSGGRLGPRDTFRRD